MTLRFIHTADWHIGKSFGRFPSDCAGELTAARLNVIGRIATLARDNGVADVLVAGDVFDSDKLADVDVRRAIERLAAHASVTWHLLPGNHDPHRDGGLWARVMRSGLPANVVVHLTPSAVAFGDGGVLLPAPLTRKSPGADPTVFMDSLETAPGLLRIGFAHGPVQAFGSDDGVSATLDPGRVRTARLAYLALGDWHGTRQIAERCWYSGTPEPDRYTDNNPGHVLLVEVANSETATVTPLATAAFTWREADVRVHSTDDLTPLAEKIIDGVSDAHAMVVKLRLSGALALSSSSALDAWIATWSAKFRHLDVDASHVSWRASANDLDRLRADPALLEAAQRLDAMARDTSNTEASVAALALLKLYRLADEAVVEAAP